MILILYYTSDLIDEKYFKCYNYLPSILQVKNDVSDRPWFSVIMRGNKNYKPVVFLRAEKPNNIFLSTRNIYSTGSGAVDGNLARKVLSCIVLTNQHSDSLHTNSFTLRGSNHSSLYSDACR